MSRRAWLCVPVRPCDEMATALIVWHRAAAAFCQKSSSESPTGLMAHLTNASPTKRANNADPTDRRKSGWGGEVEREAGSYRCGTAPIQLTQIWDAGESRVTRAFRASFDCVFYSKSSTLCTCTTCNTSTAVLCLNHKSPLCDHARQS